MAITNQGHLNFYRNRWSVSTENGYISIDRKVNTNRLNDGEQCTFKVRTITPRNGNKPFQVAYDIKPIITWRIRSYGLKRFMSVHLSRDLGLPTKHSNIIIDDKAVAVIKGLAKDHPELEELIPIIEKGAARKKKAEELEAHYKPIRDKVHNALSKAEKWFESDRTTPKERCEQINLRGCKSLWDINNLLQHHIGFSRWGTGIDHDYMPGYKKWSKASKEFLDYAGSMSDEKLFEELKSVYVTIKFKSDSSIFDREFSFRGGKEAILERVKKITPSLRVWGTELVEGFTTVHETATVLKNEHLYEVTFGNFEVHIETPEYFPTHLIYWMREESVVGGLFYKVHNNILFKKELGKALEYKVGDYIFTPSCSFPKGLSEKFLTIEHWKEAKIFATLKGHDVATIPQFELNELGIEKSYLELEEIIAEKFTAIIDSIFSAFENPIFIERWYQENYELDKRDRKSLLRVSSSPLYFDARYPIIIG